MVGAISLDHQRQLGQDGHMNATGTKKATIGKLKDHLSEYLSYVRAGGQVTVYLRDTPVATILPYQPPAPQNDAEWIDALERRGAVTKGVRFGQPFEYRPILAQGSGVLEELLAERREGR